MAKLALACLVATVAGLAAPAAAFDLPVFSMSYYVAQNSSTNATNAAYATLAAAGMNGFFFSVNWSDLDKKGVYDLSPLQPFFDIVRTQGWAGYLLIKTIDTNNLAIPDDLRESPNSNKFKKGLNWTSPEVFIRFAELLEEVMVPCSVLNVSAISVGNEVDVWLVENPDQVLPYVEFAATMSYIGNQSAPNIGVGVTMTYSGAIAQRDAPAYYWVRYLQNYTRLNSITYYPLGANFSMEDPAVASAAIADMVVYASANRVPIILQEVGYAAGYLPTPTPSFNSSAERQREFASNLFSAVAENRESFLWFNWFLLEDFNADLCDYFVKYYRVKDPNFREYICTLGVLSADGSEKPAFDQIVYNITQLRNS